ncbi:MAG: hypothetical protein OHK0022_21090 [Roseiflexaceae bacterium]
MQLYRPVGLIELQRIYESGMRAFPPRLPEQPIFYPVLNAAYAEQIARDWNTKSHTFAGYVTAFTVDDGYAAQFERRVVGGRTHEELWVPAEQLAEFNAHILGQIGVGAAFFGPQFRGLLAEYGPLKGREAEAQFALLAELHARDVAGLLAALRSNHLAVFLHLPFWRQHDFAGLGIAPEQQAQALAVIEAAWPDVSPGIPLPGAA